MSIWKKILIFSSFVNLCLLGLIAHKGTYSKNDTALAQVSHTTETTRNLLGRSVLMHNGGGVFNSLRRHPQLRKALGPNIDAIRAVANQLHRKLSDLSEEHQGYDWDGLSMSFGRNGMRDSVAIWWRAAQDSIENITAGAFEAATQQLSPKQRQLVPTEQPPIKHRPIQKRIAQLGYVNAVETRLILASLDLDIQLLATESIRQLFELVPPFPDPRNIRQVSFAHLRDSLYRSGDDIDLEIGSSYVLKNPKAEGYSFLVNGKEIPIDKDGVGHYQTVARQPGKLKIKVGCDGYPCGQSTYEYVVFP